MDNKGQSTVIFIILIPIFLLVLAFIFDNALIIVQNTRYKSVTKTIINDMLSNSYSDYPKFVKEMYEKNGYETDSLDVKYENNYLIIYNDHSYQSFFGNLLGIKSYRIEVNYQGHVENNEVIIEEIKKDSGE